MIPLEQCLARAARLKLMIFDVDGTLTDGSLHFADDGSETKVFHSLDGHGMRMLQASGVRIAIVTGRNAPCVDWRMKNLGIEYVYQGVGDKLAILPGLLGRAGVMADEAGFMGDDLIDLKIMAACGFSAAPGDGHDITRQYADYVTRRAGGHGAAREVCDFILAAQGRLDAALAEYLPAAAPRAG